MKKTGSLVGKGHNADVFDNGDGTVTKVYHPDMPEHLWADDYRTSMIVSKYYKGMPTVRGLADGKLHPGIVFEKVEGVNLLERILQHPAKIVFYAREFAKTHVEIGRTLVADLADQRIVLAQKIRCSDHGGIEQGAIVDWLSSTPKSCSLCHNDFMPTNVIYTKGRMVTIDWRTASMGDPCSDIARTLVLNMVPREDIGISRSEDLLRRIFITAYLIRYAKLSGHSRKRIRDWLLPQAAVRLNEEHVSDAEKKRLRLLIKKGLKRLAGTRTSTVRRPIDGA